MPTDVPSRSAAFADVNSRAIACLRIGVGVLFLFFGEYKVFGTRFTLGGGFEGWIKGFLAEGAYPFMLPVLRGFVLTHATAIAFVVAYGELAIGLSLVSGLLVRLASACGLIYMLALLFSSNYPGPGAAPWQYLGASLDHSVLALCFGAFVLGRPAERLSVGGTPPPPVHEATHFILYVADQRRSAAFYRATLAIEPRLDVPGMTEFELPGGGVLGLMPAAGIRRLLGDALPNPEQAQGVPRAELYILVSDPAAYHSRALAAGAKELSPLLTRDWGHVAAYSLDPDGHVLAIASAGERV